MKPLEFWFEFASTYSYPAAARIEALARVHGVELRWRPFLLGPIFQAQGWNDSPFNIYEAKGRYMWRDLARICDAAQLPLKRPSVFPRNGLTAARVARAFETEAWLPEFVRSVYRANFAFDQDISDAQVIGSILERLGQSPESVLGAANSADNKAALRSQTEGAIRLGVFGAPSFSVGDELFWGNDRLEQALEWARRDA